MSQESTLRGPTSSSDDPVLHLLTLASSFLISRALILSVQLGVADRLADGPRSADDLAAATRTHARSLGRVLRALASAGVFAVDADGRFANTAASDRLRAAHPRSLHDYILVLAEDWTWQSAFDLKQSVETGEPAFDLRHGKPIYEHFKERPDQARVFDKAMTAYARTSADAVAAAYPLPPGARLVDLGGGHGHQLEAFLRASPGTQGVLFDLPHVIEAARPRVERSDVADRCELVGGDFFEAVPEGADYYMLRTVLHNWSDDHAVAVLKNCRAAMAAGGKVLLVEVVVSPDMPLLGGLLDLHMQILTVGRERTVDEFRAIYERAGLRLSRIVESSSVMRIIEGVAGA